MIKYVDDLSLLFSEDKLILILLDKDFKCVDAECSVFTEVYSVSYRECKRAFENEDTHKAMYCYPIGKDRHVIYAVPSLLDPNDFKVRLSALVKSKRNCNYISMLHPNYTQYRLGRFFSRMDLNFKSFSKSV